MERFDTYNLQQKPDIKLSVTVLLLCILFFVGLWARVWGLDERPLARDEYYFIRSVQNILEYGIPRYPSGGYYVRGIFSQYLTAISILLFGDGGVGYRLSSALLGAGTLLMAYFLGRQFLNRSWSILLVAILTFSSWEIELSRFARMYAAFQFMAVCFFWSLYRYSFSGTSRKRYLAVAFAMMAILTHELGIFVTPFLFLPFPAWLDRDWRRLLSEQRFYIAMSSAVISIGIFLLKYPFRFIGVSDPLPLDYVRLPGTTMHLSSFGTDLFGAPWFFSIGALASACLAGWYWRDTFRDRPSAPTEKHLLGGLFVIAVCSAVFHQFVISVVILVVVVLREPALLVKKPYRYLLAMLAMIVALWSALLFYNHVWMDTSGLGTMAGTYRRSFRLAFLSFPDLYLPVFKAWAQNVPVLGCLLGVGVAWQIISVRRLSLASVARNPVIPIAIVVFAFGFFSTPEIETRYSHFLYPLALCVGLLSASQVGDILNRRFNLSESVGKTLAIILCVILFSMSEDVNAFHFVHPNSDSVAYRTGRYEKYSGHWYPRWDFLRPAELVNAYASDDSRIIIMSSANTVAAYLKPKFAIYWPREDLRFTLISRKGGTRELWSDGQLLSTFADVKEYTQESKIVWLVLYPGWGTLDPEAIWPGRVQNVEVFTPGRDKRIEVWKIELI